MDTRSALVRGPGRPVRHPPQIELPCRVLRLHAIDHGREPALHHERAILVADDRPRQMQGLLARRTASCGRADSSGAGGYSA